MIKIYRKIFLYKKKLTLELVSRFSALVVRKTSPRLGRDSRDAFSRMITFRFKDELDSFTPNQDLLNQWQIHSAYPRLIEEKKNIKKVAKNKFL